ncbi:hypothetical protein LLH03_08255 [bacterium]|nr:hypothetical protein [bacterium]
MQQIAVDKHEYQDYRRRGVTLRILLISLVVAPVNAYFMADLHRRGIEDPTVVSLFWNCLFLLVMFRLINGVLHKWAPRYAFSPAELLCFFILISVSTCASGLDTLKTSWGTMQGYAYFATPENKWEDLFGKYMPLSMTVNDMPALERLWRGDSSIFDARNYRVWGPVILRWWLLFTFMWGAPAGLAVLFRKRWVERERMSFPIVQLPFELSRTSPSGLRTPVFWIAFGAAALINIINGLNVFFPSIPVIPVKIGQSEMLNLSKFFVGRPWDAVGRFHACFYPFITGLGLLLPQELSLSLWLFYLLWKGEAIFAAWTGVSGVREYPFMKEQSFGGYLALIGFALWAARGHFKEVWQCITSRTPSSYDEKEPLRYRAAFLIFLAGLVYCIAAGISIKMAWWVSAAFFVQYYLMTMMVGRVRAEMGLPTHEIERLGPTVMQGNILGVKILGMQNITSLSVFFGFTRGMRNIPYPHMFEGLYLTERLGADSKKLLLACMAFVPIGTFFAYFWNLHLGYQCGLGADWAKWMPWSSQEAWNQLSGWARQPEGFNWWRTGATLVGFVFYFGLMVVRTTWVWWPIHPAGYAISTTWYMAHMWMPMLLAWTVKSLVSRYGGIKGVRSLAPAAFGLILGDVMTGALWTIYSMFTRVNTYAFWP